MSLELQAANGACDLKITIYHGESDAVAEDEMPAALLAQCQRELPFGTMLMRRLYKAVHILPGRSLEFRVREAVEPELERINVRRVLGEKLDELKAEQTACYEQEIAAKREKVAQADSLLPGQIGLRCKPLKLATITAKGAREACDTLMADLPERAPGEEAMLQFDWLPTSLAEQRCNQAIAEPQAELERLRPSIEARERAKPRSRAVA